MAEPRTSRPHAPGYGIDPGTEGLLPWSWATERLASSRSYWISTVTPAGIPHAMPVWGVWRDDRLYFSTGHRSKKARNLAANPSCSATTESATEAVIVEGNALLAPQSADLTPARADYKAKYGNEYDLADPIGQVYVLAPRKVFALIDKDDLFPSTATRWIFD